MSRLRMWIAFGTVLGMGLAAVSASALSVGNPPFQVNPIYFKSGGNLGFVDPGNAYDFPISGPAQPLSIQINLQTPVWQNPQDTSSSLNPSGPQPGPTQANPFVADSIWTVTNTTDGRLNNAYLILEGVDLTGGYPDLPVAMDMHSYYLSANGQSIPHLFSIVKYVGSDENTYFFGALPLGSLGAGASTQIDVRYIVAGALPTSGGSLLMPPLLYGVVTVPEPGTLLLLGTGLALFAASRRRRCA